MLEFGDRQSLKRLRSLNSYERFCEVAEFGVKTDTPFEQLSKQYQIPACYRLQYNEMREARARERYLAEHPTKTEIELLEEQIASAMGL